MKRLTLSAFLLLTLASAAWGQKDTAGPPNAKCTLTATQAPELRGFRLGMNQERALARFPGVSLERADQFGFAKVKITLMNHDDYPGGSVGRDRGVQIDIAAAATEGRSYLVDGSRYPDLRGVKGIRLQFVNGRVSYLQIGYDESVAWSDVDEFTRVISKPLGLDGTWKRGADADNETKQKELSCDGVLITAALGADPGDYHIGARLSLEDTVATATIEKRQSDLKEKAKRDEEERRKAFKP